MSYNFEESCLVKKQISGDLLKGISKGRIKLENTVVEKLERIQSGSYSAMPIDRILELARGHKIDSELRNEEDKKNLEENKKIIKIREKERDQKIKEERDQEIKEFSEANKDKKLHVFLIKKSRMEMDGWGEELSNDIDHFIYIANGPKIKLKKELKKSTEFERDRYDGKLELIEEGKNSFTFTVENDDEPWEEYTYTLVGQKELDLPILMEPLGESQKFLMDIKSLILDSSRVIEKDITDSQKNLLFFDPSALAKEVSKNLKDLKRDQVNILIDEIKKILGV
jgi:hypothetical protein